MTESHVVNRWMEKGRLEETKRLLIRLLGLRFPNQVSPAVAETINAQASLAMLEDWFDQACQVGSMGDFYRLLRE